MAGPSSVPTWAWCVGEIAGDLAEQFGVHRHEGVFVNEVMPDSPAAKAGVQEGDIITEFGGKHVATPGQLQQLVERTPLSTQGRREDPSRRQAA